MLRVAKMAIATSSKHKLDGASASDDDDDGSAAKKAKTLPPCPYGALSFVFLVLFLFLSFLCFFLFLFWIPALKPLIFLLGTAFHTGIILSLNVYPFGFAMLVHYFLLIPENALDRFEQSLRVRAPRLRIYYDEQCPLCRRTVLVLSHLDIRHALQCLPLGEHAMNAPELARVCEADLLKDLYSIDDQGRLNGSGGSVDRADAA